MYLCNTDKAIRNLAVALNKCIPEELPLDDVNFENVLKAAKSRSSKEMAEHLNNLPGVRTIPIEQDILTEEFYSGDKWFAEGVQSDKSAGLLWNNSTEEYMSLIFYDKEFNLWVVEYPDIDLVPIDAVVRNPLESMLVCIIEPKLLYGKYETGVLIQG